MKSTLVIILFLLSSICFANQKDTTNLPKIDSAILKQQAINAAIDAINFVVNDMKRSIRISNMVSDDEQAVFLKVLSIYIDEKNKQFKPNK